LEAIAPKLAASPRILFTILPAQVLDEILPKLAATLHAGDVIIDSANANYKDTIRRHAEMKQLGIDYIDVGFSGGPSGALQGGCLMIGGEDAVYEKCKDILFEMAAPGAAKHFPGGSMILDPHRMDIFQHTDKDELKLFDAAISAGVKAIMIGQTIAEKEINPNRYPATISYETIKHLRSKFNGLIVSDDIDMWGLKDFPPKKDYYERIYVKIISAGNDIILHTHPILLTNPFASLYKRILSGITSLERAVNNGLISEERINQSVKRILKLKGYKVI
jgi:hypothetical protein